MGIALGVTQEYPALQPSGTTMRSVHSVSMQVAPYTPPERLANTVGQRDGSEDGAFCGTRKELEVLGGSERQSETGLRGLKASPGMGMQYWWE